MVGLPTGHIQPPLISALIYRKTIRRRSITAFPTALNPSTISARTGAATVVICSPWAARTHGVARSVTLPATRTVPTSSLTSAACPWRPPTLCSVKLARSRAARRSRSGARHKAHRLSPACRPSSPILRPDNSHQWPWNYLSRLSSRWAGCRLGMVLSNLQFRITDTREARVQWRSRQISACRLRQCRHSLNSPLPVPVAVPQAARP